MSWVIEGLLINYWKFSLFLVNDPADSVLKHEQKDIEKIASSFALVYAEKAKNEQ